jgi:hypothetical protein
MKPADRSQDKDKKIKNPELELNDLKQISRHPGTGNGPGSASARTGCTCRPSGTLLL